MVDDLERALALVPKLEGLLEKATAGDLTTAERHVEEETIECPVCGGDGEVLASDYCNIDSKALGVQFYGVGNEFGAHEALWKETIHALPTLLSALRTVEERGQLAMSDSADLPNRTWTFGLPRDATVSGGIYRITFVRPVTAKDHEIFGSSPEEGEFAAPLPSAPVSSLGEGK